MGTTATAVISCSTLGICILAAHLHTTLTPFTPAQIQMLTRSRSAQGISFLSFELETLCLLIHASYGYVRGLPINTYGESIMLGIQVRTSCNRGLRWASGWQQCGKGRRGAHAALHHFPLVLPLILLARRQQGMLCLTSLCMREPIRSPTHLPTPSLASVSRLLTYSGLCPTAK